jgi:hypothetical protein
MEDRQVDRGDFIFAQVRYSGDYDPHPAACASLLAEAMKATSLGARFRRKVVSLSATELSAYPFLYLTGHGDFRLSEEEAKGLGRYLSSGGFLLADACCGDLGFDVAFRREISRALPSSKLEPIPSAHTLFSSFEDIREAGYTTAVRASFPDLKAPFLEGIEIGGALGVVYSRFDLGNGWDGEDRPFALGFEPRDARRIGVNIIVYSLTH